MPADKSTRGEANNNPGNIIRDTTPWLDLVSRTEAADKQFCQFETAIHGIRALTKIPPSYQRIDGCRTLGAVISRYASQTGNDADAYLRHVVARTEIGAGQTLDLEHPSELANVARAIIVHENGRCPYDVASINEAVSLALSA